MTFPPDIDADTENIDIEMVLAFFTMVFIFLFWLTVRFVVMFRAKVVITFHNGVTPPLKDS